MKTVKGFVLMTDRSHIPDCSIPGLLCYEELIGPEQRIHEWPVFDENTASSLCYTSGRPAIRRAFSTRTAHRCCIPSPPARPM